MQNNKFPPSIDPNLFTLIAVAVGYACVGNFDVNEQNSIGNWIIMVGQYVLTHAAQQQLNESRIEKSNINTNSQKYKSGQGGPYTDNEKGKSNQTQRDEVELLLEAVSNMQKELQKIRENKNA